MPTQLEVDPTTVCAWPPCGRPLDQHPAGSTPYHVDGQPVGSAACAEQLYTDLHPPTGIRVKPCCGVWVGERCDCLTFAARAADPRIRIGGAR